MYESLQAESEAIKTEVEGTELKAAGVKKKENNGLNRHCSGIAILQPQTQKGLLQYVILRYALTAVYCRPTRTYLSSINCYLSSSFTVNCNVSLMSYVATPSQTMRLAEFSKGGRT